MTHYDRSWYQGVALRMCCRIRSFKYGAHDDDVNHAMSNGFIDLTLRLTPGLVKTSTGSSISRALTRSTGLSVAQHTLACFQSTAWSAISSVSAIAIRPTSCLSVYDTGRIVHIDFGDCFEVGTCSLRTLICIGLLGGHTPRKVP